MNVGFEARHREKSEAMSLYVPGIRSRIRSHAEPSGWAAITRRPLGLLLLLLLTLLSIASPAESVSPYHSETDDGVASAMPFYVPLAAPQTLHLYVDGGATPTATGTPCHDGDGQEMCSWLFELAAEGSMELVSFSPNGSAEFAISQNRLRVTGGDFIDGALGQSKIGDLIIDPGTGGGAIKVVEGSWVDAKATLVLVPRSLLVFAPEPHLAPAIVASVLTLSALARLRR